MTTLQREHYWQQIMAECQPLVCPAWHYASSKAFPIASSPTDATRGGKLAPISQGNAPVLVFLASRLLNRADPLQG